jgi:UDP-N-acetylmuramate--alanine ligase
MRVPGRHTALNAAAAVALVSSLVRKEFGLTTCNLTAYDTCGQSDRSKDGWNEERREEARKALEEFGGSKRRSEILGEAGGILFMDDYGHHPTEIKTTLAGLKEFYPGRRLVVSFMSHTYTRTASLLDEFAASFEKADLILLHKIYASAREVYHGGVTGRTLFERTREILSGVSAAKLGKGERFFYIDEPEDGAELLSGILKRGDLFITMGAGDNWKLGRKLFEHYGGASL